MRTKLTESGLTVHAIAGTHVVYMGMDLVVAKRKGCLGFAVQREDHTEDERIWMRGIKTFKEVEPFPDPGVQVSSHEHPFQTFQWADYTAKPEHDYTYTVIPLYGKPARLVDGDPVSVKVRTESEHDGRHSVFFNRGAVASQEYARRFQNREPAEVGEIAYRWLSRGLLEALLDFFGRAKDGSFGIYGAVYEFQWPMALNALREAAKRGAKVRIIYDSIAGGTGPEAKNEEAIAEAKIQKLTIPRTEGKLMHDKFFVLTRNEKPVAVWTGSTNLTENGIFGHSNCGHVVEDSRVAGIYLKHWQKLKEDPVPQETKEWIETTNVAPPDPWNEDTTVVFSPRGVLDPLDWYAQIAGSARKGLFMTFAFGMNKRFQEVYEQNDGVLRFALMEKEGNGKGLEQGRKDIRRIRSLPNVVVAVGNNIRLNAFDRWLKEIDRVTSEVNVRWIHTKYMLVDPLGDNPVVVTGSANFSEASTTTNDENMIVIRNDQRIADIYLGEFMRLHAHYAFREAVAIALKNDRSFEDWQPKYLLDTDRAWQKDYFTKGNQRCLRRLYFAGSEG
jgi:hypothetical protein